MEFKNDHLSLSQPFKKTFSLIGLKLPTNKDVYFRAKQKELVDQYSAARIFLQETDCKNWEHWTGQIEEGVVKEGIQNMYKSFLYEAALIYYNILVDLSWTMCYVCAEFAISSGEERIDFSGIKPIEEAAELLRKAEGFTTNPTAEANPFDYLKKMNPDYEKAIDLIVGFWTCFGSSDIRKKYNYIKHKGKPAYSEIVSLQGRKFVGFYTQSKGEKTVAVPSDIRDVQWEVSLEDSIAELYRFDDEQLFPYLESLLRELERVVDPSPIVD